MTAANPIPLATRSLCVAALAALSTASGCTCNGSTPPPPVEQPGDSATGATGGPGSSTEPPGAGQGPSTAAAPAGVDPLALACRRAARDVQGDAGTSVYVTCPAGCLEHGRSVWGTGLYTDDSAVCPALIHAGALGPGGGVARVTFVAGQLAYWASDRNGVRSNSFGKFGRSFYGQAIDAQGAPTQPAPEILDDKTARFDCSMRGTTLKSDSGTSYRVICPKGCDQGTVYGTGTYTYDSAVCSAAVHAGVIGADGGSFTITYRPGQGSYEGSEQHGIQSRSYGKYSRSFEVTAKQ